jgi:hypothetical protein
VGLQRWGAALASSWEQSAPPSEDLRIPFIVTDPNLHERIGDLAHIEKGPCFSEHRPDLRRGTGPLRFSLSCLGFLFSLGRPEGIFLFPEGSLTVIWLEVRSGQLPDCRPFLQKMYRTARTKLRVSNSHWSTFRNFGAMVRIPVVCSIMS